MALPPVGINPDDPEWRGKTWDAVERALDARDELSMSLRGVDQGLEAELRGPTGIDPCKPLYTTFPWEEKVGEFERPASCTLDSWKHECLKVTIGKQAVTLQFNKAAANNTLDPAMLDALQDAVMDLRARSNVRVVVLRSEGKLFSNGFDPKYLISESNMTENQIQAIQSQFARILLAFQNLPQLTVALIQGSAMGAAVGLVCACDIVYAVKGAFFAMSETKLGAVATTSIPYIIRRVTYIKNAYQLVLAGASLSADDAKEFGIVTEVVDNIAGLESECKTLCDKMTLCAPGAVAATKEVVMNTLGVPPSSFMLEYLASVLEEVRKGPEARGGIEAIQSRRKPKWAEAPIAA